MMPLAKEVSAFQIYYDDECFDLLNDDQAGKLIKALLEFGRTGAEIQTTDISVLMAFKLMRAKIVRDAKNYSKTRHGNRAKGKTETASISASVPVTETATVPVPVTVSGTVSVPETVPVTVSVKEREINKEKETERENIPSVPLVSSPNSYHLSNTPSEDEQMILDAIERQGISINDRVHGWVIGELAFKTRDEVMNELFNSLEKLTQEK